jgi:hypothetical protein
MAENNLSRRTLELAPAAAFRPAIAHDINMACVGLKSNRRENPAHGFGGTLVPLLVPYRIQRVDPNRRLRKSFAAHSQ